MVDICVISIEFNGKDMEKYMIEQSMTKIK